MGNSGNGPTIDLTTRTFPAPGSPTGKPHCGGRPLGGASGVGGVGGGGTTGERRCLQVIPYDLHTRDLILEDDSLSIKPLMLIWAPLIPATRWTWGSTAAPPRISDNKGGDKGYPDKHHIGNI